MNRRTFLGAAASAGIASIAGCLEGTVTPGSDGGSDGSDESDGEEPSDEDPGADEPDSPDESGEPDSDDSAAPADDTDETNGDGDGPTDENTEPGGIEDGCPRGFAPAEGAWSNREQTEDGNTSVTTADLELDCGEYAIQQYSPQYAVEFEYEVGGVRNYGLEVIVMERREFDRFREGESFVYSPGITDSGKNPSGSGEFSAGEYVFVFDNSAHGESMPEGPIDAPVEIRVSWA